MIARQLTLEDESIRRREKTLNPARRVDVLSLDNFDGSAYDPEHDYARLKTQLERVRFLLRSTTAWWTLRDLAARTNSSEAGVSARVRDLRKPRFGGFVVVRRRVCVGLLDYRIMGVAR